MSYVTTPMIFYILNYINEIWRKTKVGIFVSLDMFCKLYYICPWFMNFNFHWSDWICNFIHEIESSDFIEDFRIGIRPYFTCQIPRFQIIRQIQLKYTLNLKKCVSWKTFYVYWQQKQNNSHVPVFLHVFHRFQILTLISLITVEVEINMEGVQKLQNQ